MTDKKHINDLLKNPDKNFNENCTHDKEQIIIDDVDVSKCTLYGDGRCNNACNPLNCLFCSEKPNCHYKQLARKTQKCEEQENKIKKLRKNLALEIESNTRYRNALEEIENFMNYEFSGQNEWVKTSILDIINKAKGEGNE